ncbi:MAG: potassium channel family protein [Bacteriovoracales bacterium]|nr:potassium channel family protein [Bacteriovoracales bacterium]
MTFFQKGLHINKILFRLIFGRLFLFITVVGNTIIVGFSSLFYWVEYPTNPSIESFLDALWWGFATATTVGYGDITPVTTAGKIVGITLMLLGTAIFAIYTALFAETILKGELSPSNAPPDQKLNKF